MKERLALDETFGSVGVQELDALRSAVRVGVQRVVEQARQAAAGHEGAAGVGFGRRRAERAEHGHCAVRHEGVARNDDLGRAHEFLELNHVLKQVRALRRAGGESGEHGLGLVQHEQVVGVVAREAVERLDLDEEARAAAVREREAPGHVELAIAVARADRLATHVGAEPEAVRVELCEH